MKVGFSKVNGRRVVGTGSVFTFNNEPIVLSIADRSDLRQKPLSISFKFSETESGRPDIILEGSDHDLTITFVNYNNPLGSGTKEPLMIAEGDEGEALYMHFKIAGPSGGGDKLLYYTFFEAKGQKAVAKSKTARGEKKVSKNGRKG